MFRLAPAKNHDEALPGTIESMAQALSNEDSIASEGKVVLLMRSQNGGGNQRYGCLEPLGDDAVDALRETDIAYKVITEAEMAPLVEIMTSAVEDDNLIDLELRFYQFGTLLQHVETPFY